MLESSRLLLPISDRGVITLPAELCRRHGLDEPGAQLRVHEREDGVIELIPHVAVPKDQEWFWTPEWQAMEHEVDEELFAGRYMTFDTSEDFLAHLTSLVDE